MVWRGAEQVWHCPFGRVALLCVGLLCGSSVHASELVKYVNVRFGTSALVPSHFQPAPEAANRDGQVFIAPGGRGEIRIWAGFNVLGETMAGYRQERMGYFVEDGGRITYQPKGRSWFVLSGHIGDEIFYLKAMHGTGCSAELIHHISFRYPTSDKRLWDGIVKAGAASLSGPCQ